MDNVINFILTDGFFSLVILVLLVLSFVLRINSKYLVFHGKRFNWVATGLLLLYFLVVPVFGILPNYETSKFEKIEFSNNGQAYSIDSEDRQHFQILKRIVLTGIIERKIFGRGNSSDSLTLLGRNSKVVYYDFNTEELADAARK